jgi:hypothetical protein
MVFGACRTTMASRGAGSEPVEIIDASVDQVMFVRLALVSHGDSGPPGCHTLGRPVPPCLRHASSSTSASSTTSRESLATAPRGYATAGPTAHAFTAPSGHRGKVVELLLVGDATHDARDHPSHGGQAAAQRVHRVPRPRQPVHRPSQAVRRPGQAVRVQPRTWVTDQTGNMGNTADRALS